MNEIEETYTIIDPGNFIKIIPGYKRSSLKPQNQTVPITEPVRSFHLEKSEWGKKPVGVSVYRGGGHQLTLVCIKS